MYGSLNRNAVAEQLAYRTFVTNTVSTSVAAVTDRMDRMEQLINVLITGIIPILPPATATAVNLALNTPNAGPPNPGPSNPPPLQQAGPNDTIPLDLNATGDGQEGDVGETGFGNMELS